MKHEWKRITNGMYESDWECTCCGEIIETSSDAPNNHKFQMERDDCPLEQDNRAE